MKTLFIKSLLASLFQREELSPSLAKRGEGRFYDVSSLKCLFVILLLAASFLIAAETAAAQERVTVGEVEDIVLLPWGVRLPARIDTGASTSSLDARELKVRGNLAEFRLPKEYGGLLLKLPIVDWREVKTAAAIQRRPVVEVTLCLGPKPVRAQMTLTDRSMLEYPVLVGRNVLRERFVVDCTLLRCAPPQCPEIFSK